MTKILGYEWEDIKNYQQKKGSLSKPIDTTKPGDYGFDPMGDGMVKMVPSGDILTIDEALKRLGRSY